MTFSGLSDKEILQIAFEFLGLEKFLAGGSDVEYRLRNCDGSLRDEPTIELRAEDVGAFIRREALPSLEGVEAVREAASLLSMNLLEDLADASPPSRCGLRRTPHGDVQWFGEA
ncbi:hypothetical protein AADG42_16350 [Ammonicoccus fulvus]|uniref:Uncharacterized protein n=1 Tax=Ammonicoccus fulvus TaxID=3138240 RepID=A0ABZ3FUF8_9ACTN